jgi:hypothetical protein
MVFTIDMPSYMGYIYYMINTTTTKDTEMPYVDNRSPRAQLQDELITRIIDGMDWSDMARYVYDKLDEELGELDDEELTAQVAEDHPDLLEGV